MSTRSEAEENLRTIRSLMERATIYRAISAPTALAGGLLSIIACSVFHYRFRNPDSIGTEDHFIGWFLGVWLGTLALTLAANTYFIWQDAKRRSEPFISPGMKLALVSILPALLCGAFFTVNSLFSVTVYAFVVFLLPPIWMMCYGAGLLSTSHFAPRSIPILGWVFLITGFGTYLYLGHCFDFHPVRFFYIGNLFMGATFGFYHLIYAACTWPRKSTIASTTTPGDEP